MNSSQTLVIAAVLAGAFFLAVALLLQLRGTRRIPARLVPKWRLISALLAFFLCSYLLSLLIFTRHLEFPLENLISSIFMVGGFFVLVITRMTLRALEQIVADEKQLKDVNLELQQSNLELVEAYDSTIEGWGLALDLRDHETEGHSQRVAGIAEEIATRMGMLPEQLVHLKRGALLHDIGKMAVSDKVLFKDGPLSEEERELMNHHPRYAYEMLSSIDYLKPALDIPYCHHERWDGNGYPRGIRGEDIPLAARIFAVVDSWDALTSTRRYHDAWPKKKACDLIASEAGSHFDPEVVKVFLAMDFCRDQG